MLEVTYTLTEGDYHALMEHLWEKASQSGPRRDPIWWLPWSWVPWVFALQLSVLFAVFDSKHRLVGILGVGVVLAVLVMYPVMRWLRPRSPGKREFAEAYQSVARGMSERGELGRITLTLTNQILTERTTAGASVVRWRDMPGVEVAGDYTFIQVTSELFAIIPRHGFDREEDYAAVRDFALAKLSHKS